MNDTAVPPARTNRVKWGRIISLAGALGLCVSFFTPHVDFYIRGAVGRWEATAPVQFVTRGGFYIADFDSAIDWFQCRPAKETPR